MTKRADRRPRQAGTRGPVPKGYNEAQVKALSGWLGEKYVERSRAYTPRFPTDRYTIDDFGRDIGIKGGTLGHWMRGIRMPGEASIRQLAVMLGYDIYDVMELPRPDEHWEVIEREWAELSLGAKAEIARIALADLERQRTANDTEEQARADGKTGGTSAGLGATKRRGKA